MHIDGNKVSLSSKEATFIKRVSWDERLDITSIVFAGQLDWANNTVPRKFRTYNPSEHEPGMSRGTYLIGMANLLQRGSVNQEVIHVELSEEQLKSIRALASTAIKETQEDLLTVKDILTDDDPDSHDMFDGIDDIYSIIGRDDEEDAEELSLAAEVELFEEALQKIAFAKGVIASIDLAINTTD